MSIRSVYSGLGCFCCKVCIEGDDGSRDDELSDDDDGLGNDNELEDVKEEVWFLLFFDDDGWRGDEIENDKEELEDMCIISCGEFEIALDDVL